MYRIRAPRTAQRRSTQARQRIIQGAISVLASAGAAGLTHRAVAAAADVSLAGTTYHFNTLQDILGAASLDLLDGHLRALLRLRQDIRTGKAQDLRSLDGLIHRIVWVALNQGRERALAWGEIMLLGGRSEHGRALIQRWYTESERILLSIGQTLDPAFKPEHAPAALDEAVGLLFLLQALRLKRAELHRLLSGRADPEDLRARTAPALTRTLSESVQSEPPQPMAPQQGGSTEAPGTRQRIVDAAVDVVILEGVGAVSYRSVAERVNLVRSAASYYFPTIDSLLEGAQSELFRRAQNRYREGVGAWARGDIDKDRLTDLTTVVLMRESLEFRKENLAYCEVWLRQARVGNLDAVAEALVLSPHRAWRRRLTQMTRRAHDKRAPFRMQALFTGKVIRATVAGADTDMLARMRGDLADAIHRATLATRKRKPSGTWRN